jgi:thiol-disulfide isomerase/thioredoxin
MTIPRFLTLIALLAIGSFSMLSCRGNTSVKRLSFPFVAAADLQTQSGDSSVMRKIDLPKQRENAPEFPHEFAWVNTDRPLLIHNELKGNVVVLDFWTYCCINCMHILPDLEYLEHKYAGQPVTIIGVHSAKFDNEGDRRNILQACQRYDIAHPVIIDENHRIWSEYTVNSWPTLMVIDPEGKVVGRLSGEGNREALDAVICSLLEEGKERGTLASAPPQFERKARVPSASGLAFPGKVLAEPSGKYLFISDSNHDRVIIANPAGNVIAIAGSGRKGNSDGSFTQAEFHNPQGLAYDAAKNVLYIADTDNHLIRKLDLSAKTVETISGTGRQEYDRTGGKRGREQGLNSPWDLTLVGDKLFIAMAGPHQLWVLDLNDMTAQAWVGSGREDIVDSPGMSAALAQPSGIVQKGEWLYFADSEVSAVRRANLNTKKVETLIGSGLFDFGDREGEFSKALLQHPLGVAVYGNDILVADTYNHKIKRLNEQAKRITTIAGNDEPEPIARDRGELSLYEPGGISVLNDSLYIADTNHDRVVVFDLKNNSWHELNLKGLQAEKARRMDVANVPVKDVKVKPMSDITLRLAATFPRGIHLNREAPINYAFMSLSDGLNGNVIEGLAPSARVPVEVKIPASAIKNGETYQTALSLAYCTDENEGLCVPITLAWKLKVTEDPSANSVIELAETVKPIH